MEYWKTRGKESFRILFFLTHHSIIPSIQNSEARQWGAGGKQR